MAQEFKIKQGETTPVIRVYSTQEDLSLVDWSCVLVVKKKLGVDETKEINKAVTYDGTAGGFLCYLDPTESASLSVGKHYMTIKLTNLNRDIPYAGEVYSEELSIEPSGA